MQFPPIPVGIVGNNPVSHSAIFSLGIEAGRAILQVTLHKEEKEECGESKSSREVEDHLVSPSPSAGLPV